MQSTLWVAELIDEDEIVYSVIKETEDEIMESVTDYLKEKYPWAVEDYHITESLDYFLEEWDFQLETYIVPKYSHYEQR